VDVIEVEDVWRGKFVTVAVASFLLCDGIKFVALGFKGVDVFVPAAN
jgi:hypothetical protein